MIPFSVVSDVDFFYQDGSFSSDDELDEGVVDASDEDVDDVFLIVRSRLPFGLILDEWGADGKASDVGFRCVKVVKARTRLNEWWMWTSGSSIPSWGAAVALLLKWMNEWNDLVMKVWLLDSPCPPVIVSRWFWRWMWPWDCCQWVCSPYCWETFG